jgi:hypothetical protein
LILTVHFGVTEDPTQRRAFFPGSLHALLSEYGGVESIEVRDGLIHAAVCASEDASVRSHPHGLGAADLLALTEAAAEVRQTELLKRLRAKSVELDAIQLNSDSRSSMIQDHVLDSD